MKLNPSTIKSRPPHDGRPSIHHCLILLAALFLTTSVSNAANLRQSRAAQVISNPLMPGEIVYADSGNAIEGGFIFRVDPATGAPTPIAVGGLLRLPFDVAMDSRGRLVVSDSGRLLGIDPTTGAQRLIVDNSTGRLGIPAGIVVDARDDIIVANYSALLRVDQKSGRMTVISSGGYFRVPLGVAIGDKGDLFVVNIASASMILRVSPHNGRQTLISSGGNLHRPQSLAVSGDDIFVTDVADPYGNFGVGRVIHINARTGRQTIVTEGGWLIGPVGIAVQSNGWLVIADPYTINPASPDLYDGGIVAVSESTGEQVLIARGRMGSVNPRGVAVVPDFSSPGGFAHK